MCLVAIADSRLVALHCFSNPVCCMCYNVMLLCICVKVVNSDSSCESSLWPVSEQRSSRFLTKPICSNPLGDFLSYFQLKI